MGGEKGEWKQAVDDLGRTFFYHTVTGESRWTDPNDARTSVQWGLISPTCLTDFTFVESSRRMAGVEGSGLAHHVLLQLYHWRIKGKTHVPSRKRSSTVVPAEGATAEVIPLFL